MNVRAILEGLANGAINVSDALSKLAISPLVELEGAVVDVHRQLRQGVPEVIFGEGKSEAQILAIAQTLLDRQQNVLVTRTSPAALAAIAQAFPSAQLHPLARTARIEIEPPPARDFRVAIMTAGTTDLPVAEEANETLLAVGIRAERVVDVGVAGLHRLLSRLETLRQQDALIVIAGMEGALPSVVAGLVATPVVAVPTSVGYGSALGGLTPMMAMLTSCGSGVTVVNIDNGFGAAMAVFRMATALAQSRARDNRPEGSPA
jgi:NCAIR mutase (PurE)-related protein